jgi:hypothetical protein
MTKKHFEAIASLLNGERQELVIKFADYLRTQNPLFQRGRFLEATQQEKSISCFL